MLIYLNSREVDWAHHLPPKMLGDVFLPCTPPHLRPQGWFSTVLSPTRYLHMYTQPWGSHTCLYVTRARAASALGWCICIGNFIFQKNVCRRHFVCGFMGVDKTRKGTVINGMKIMHTNTIIHLFPNTYTHKHKDFRSLQNNPIKTII